MRKRSVRSAFLALSILVGAEGRAVAQTIAPPFNTDYTAVTLGSVPGVPTNYGGLTFLRNDPDTILIGGAANVGSGALYAIGVVRDGQNHITGFEGTASVYASAAYNDGGVAYGPSNVLFLARWPVNELGQIKLGSNVTDKVIALGPFGIVSSLSAFAFVPNGFPNAGHLKMVTYSSGDWYDATVVPDGNGTYDLRSVTHRVQIIGGPEGFIYVPPASPQFTDYSSILVAEYSAGKITAYHIDDQGDPVTTSRQDFLTGLSGAEGAAVDPVTGDFLFSTFGGFNQVVAVRGFGNPNVCNDACPTRIGCQDTCDEHTNECRECGHPFRNDFCIVNAVYVLQGSLSLRNCETCTCDVNESGTVTATDALLILRSCTGAPVNLHCSGEVATSSAR